MLNTLLLLYLFAGVVFGAWLLYRALPLRDNAAQGTGLMFKLIVIPCCILLWPVLLVAFRHGGGSGNVRGEWRHADARVRGRHGTIWMMMPVLMALVILSALFLRKG